MSDAPDSPNGPDARPGPGGHESVYDGLLGGDDTQWAFGTEVDDPLAGVDTTLPDGVDGGDLATYCLMLGDDALVMAHRLSQWCSNAPDLEEDIALANIALDLLGQARLLLARAAAADETVVPVMPVGSPVPAEDALAFFRDAPDLRNVRLVEAPRGDFGETMARLLVFASWRLALLEQLVASRDPVLAAVAAKAVHELTYHRDYAARWVLILAQGTPESRRRVVAGLRTVRASYDELYDAHPVELAVAAVGVGVDPAGVREAVDAVLGQVFAAAGLAAPDAAGPGAGPGADRPTTGRDGDHTAALVDMLQEMQGVARVHPRGSW